MDWVPIDLSTTRDALRTLPTMSERGEWITGFFQGASGALLAGGESNPFLDGFALGSVSLSNAEGNRAKISEVRREAALKRWSKQGDQPKIDAIAHANGDAIAHAKPMHKTRQDKQDKTKQSRPLPTEDEWVEYCTKTWPDWHPVCSSSSFDYYQLEGWKTKRGAIIGDWRDAAKTAHGNAVKWGTLQPKQNGFQRPAQQPISRSLPTC